MGERRAQAIIFDVDGTLLDTNPIHASAWHRALLEAGHEVPIDRVMLEIGKGGDNLVPSLLGEEIEKRDGEQLRKAQSEAFMHAANRMKFRVFHGARELLADLHRRGLKLAIATSSKRDHFQKLCAQAELPLDRLVDEVVTKADAQRSKPYPDLVCAAVERLGVAAAECLMIGDTPHDGEACRRAGVAFVAVLCGGRSRDDLTAAGARAVHRDPAELLLRVEEWLG
jgi:HAD superfamily hydrolase (TIGR01509 family)